MGDGSPVSDWAWDVSLIVCALPAEAKAAFYRELSRQRKLAAYPDAPPFPDRLENLKRIGDACGQRAAMEAEFAWRIRGVERVDGPS